jgi:hypothetical protein
MLRIKKDVDLKELEKFGFKYNKRDDKFYLKNKFNFSIAEILPDNWQGERNIGIYDTSTLAIDILYDLIQANLVEKLEE